ncbi:hypothetical protein [Actinoplanes sp. NPDC049265]|uniref:hypothetical protein n=1 Tax=Actinoplanes sp. NPDC049265 TaxID=3363902 RepID=UPI00371293D6
MDRLTSGQALPAGERLVAPAGFLELVVQGDGNVVLYRVQTAQVLWASNTFGQAVTRLVLRSDGNLVAETAHGVALWESRTAGHPGARLVLQNDGNLVIYDAGGTARWATNTVRNFNLPTLRTEDDRGYSYVETSERWKLLCQGLPCFTALQWPGYATTVVEDVIDGEPVVIQLWRGWCQKFLGNPVFPGGIGAEVGIYRRVPGKTRPASLDFLPAPLDSFYSGAIAGLSDTQLWWPAPDLGAELEFSLINPVTKEVAFRAGPQRGYWLTRWMNEDAYLKYTADQGFRIPFLPDAYILEYKVNGRVRRWPNQSSAPSASGSTMRPDQVLNSNGTLLSVNGRFRLTYQDDTNLVLYRTTDDKPLWATGVRPGGVGACIMQADGNLVLYNATGKAVWASNTNGNPGSRLTVRDDGDVVVTRRDGAVIWSSDRR